MSTAFSITERSFSKTFTEWILNTVYLLSYGREKMRSFENADVKALIYHKSKQGHESILSIFFSKFEHRYHVPKVAALSRRRGDFQTASDVEGDIFQYLEKRCVLRNIRIHWKWP